MANTLSKSGIFLGHEVDAWHVTQSVDAFTKASAYDITVSGSFTLTGSLKVSGSVLGTTTSTASYAVTSSYSNFTQTVTSASRAQYNLTDSYTIQFYSPVTSSLVAASAYNIGIGEILAIGNYVGITIPKNSIIIKASVVSTCGTTSTWNDQLDIINETLSTSYSLTNFIQYDNKFDSFYVEVPDIVASQGNRVYLQVKTDNTGASPQDVAYNITLTLLPV
jgi:hypothetical protein